MLQFAILGFGFMGKKHFDVIDALPNAKIKAIIDHHPIENNSGFEHFQNLDFFIEKKPEVDLVVIATPNYDHFFSAKKLLENGYHVLIEKPYCFTAEETTLLKETSSKTGKKIFFVNQNRFSGTAVFLKNLVAQNLLGKIYMVQTNCFWSRNQNYYQPDSWKGDVKMDGGTLYTQFFHFIDLLLWLFGDMKIKNSVFETFRHKNLIEFEDTGNIVFEIIKDKSIASLSFSTAVYENNLESSMTIIAENGTVKIAGQYFDEVVYCNIKDYEFNKNSIPKTSNFDNLIENYNHAVFTLDKDHETNMSFNVVKLIEEIYQQRKTEKF